MPDEAITPDPAELAWTTEDNQKFEADIQSIMAGQEPAPAEGEAPPESQPPPAPKPDLSKVASRFKDPEPEGEPAKPGDLPPAPPAEYKKGSTKEQWADLHAHKDHWQRRAVAAEETNKRLFDDAHKVYADRLATKDKQVTELQRELDRVAVERSPKFQQEFTAKQGQLLSKVGGLVPPAQAAEVRELLQQPATDARLHRLEEIMENLSPLRKQGFAQLVTAADQLGEERQQRVAESLANWTNDQTRAEREREQKLAEGKAAFAAVQNRYRQRYGATESAEFNQEVETALAGARNDYEADLPMDRLSEITIQARLAPVIGKVAVKLAEENQHLAAELAKLRNQEPTLEEGGTGDGSGEQSPEELITAHGSAGAAMAADLQRLGIKL